MFILCQGSASPAPPVRRLEGHQKLGGDAARTADPNWPKASSLPCDTKPGVKSGEEAGQGPTATQGLAGHWSASSERLPCASPVFSWVWFLSLLVVSLLVTIIIVIIVNFTSVLNCSYPNSWVLCFFPVVLPTPLGGAWAATWCLLASL